MDFQSIFAITMAGMSSRFSIYSNNSAVPPGAPRAAAQQGTQVSTTTLLNALHSYYTSTRPYQLDSSTSLVVNTWLTAANTGPNGGAGGTIDTELATRAWEHARRRAEDGCIVLWFVHPPLIPFCKKRLKSALANVGQFVASIDALLTGPISVCITVVNARSGLYRSFCTSSLPVDCDPF